MIKQIDEYVNKNTNDIKIELKDITIKIEEPDDCIKLKRNVYKSKSNDLYTIDVIIK